MILLNNEYKYWLIYIEISVRKISIQNSKFYELKFFPK